MKVVGWKAWYTGGRTFSSRTHSWEELPKSGVLVVMAYYEKGRAIHQNVDEYRCPTGEAGVKFGERAPDDEYLETVRRALEDDSWR